jgi:hypothetical protein
MLRTSERTLDISEEVCACFIEWQKTFDFVDWTKFLQILKRNGIDWPERRLTSKLYMDQRIKEHLYEGQTRRVRTGRGIRQRRSFSLILFNLHKEYLIKEAVEGLGDFKIRADII